MILGAIDIGSNAVRMLIAETKTFDDDQVDYTKLNFLRVPIRLGMDAFKTGSISQEKIDVMVDTMKVFQLLMKIYRVEHFKACATSAMREAKNGAEVCHTIKENAGIDIQIISGEEEASIIYETHIAENMDHHQPYLYIDVGGGSTELLLFSRGQVLFKESFNIGTIRLLNNMVSEEQMTDFKKFIKSRTKEMGNLKAIGSGGNINKIRSMSKIKDKYPLSAVLLKEFLKELGSRSVEERMHLYGLRRDRADVIVPALQIYISVMRWADIEQIYVPKIGLADGLVRVLFKQHNQGLA